MKTTLLVLSLAVATACLAEPAYVPYLNQRFSFAVEYPSGLFFARGESDNGDGQVFATKEGDAKLTVFGGWRAKELNFPCDALETAAHFAGSNVTYKWKKGAVSVASGHSAGDTVFYVKNILSKDKCVTLMLEYPAARRDAFDSVVARISNSLKD